MNLTNNSPDLKNTSRGHAKYSNAPVESANNEIVGEISNISTTLKADIA